ncbi:class I SAM-dependent methyltransferase [Corallincola platygyrae]
MVVGAETIAIDWFASNVLVTLYKEWPDQDVSVLADYLLNQLKEWQLPPTSIALQRRYLKGAPTEVLYGELADEIWAQEQGLQYRINLKQHQNHGLFLDMAEGRRWVKERAQHKRVLNLFSYTCAFSVAALAGGADEVINLDMSKGALAVGRKNHAKNDLTGARFFAHDLFNSWGKLKRLGPYDLVIVDPPSFQGSSFTLDSHYPKVIRRLCSLTEPGAEFLLCLNAPEKSSEFLIDLVAQDAPELRFVSRLPNPEVFADKYPEKSLKVLHFSRE